jgi:formamidopyrimidine-DNA glycosylase
VSGTKYFFVPDTIIIFAMPELPDVQVYLEALDRRIVGQRLEKIVVASPFVLRSYDPPLAATFGRTVAGTQRIGKRIVLEMDSTPSPDSGTRGQAPDGAQSLFIVIHLMIAGRLHWRSAGEKRKPPGILTTFEFPNGKLYFTEAGTRKRASLTVVRGEEALRGLDPGGIDPLEATFEAFDAALRRENHTVKRSLTDPHLFSGIGNAFSDEILHAAQLSPLKHTRSLSEEEARRLWKATRTTLASWTNILRAEAGEGFPEKVTAFREGMAVHGRFGKPCPVCQAPVQRIVYAENECNYCARCQTGGKLLADRSLSRLLKDDWPKSIDDL